MNTKKRGKLIYQPSGAAAEYSKWACNLYNGCSNRCEYCYNRHSQGKNLLGKDEPTIKGGMSEDEAYSLFCYELNKFRDDIIRDGGLFFSFVSDPLLPETWELNTECIVYCLYKKVPVILLTKETGWKSTNVWKTILKNAKRDGYKDIIKFGFTLTGCDDLEPYASTNEQRIKAMKHLYISGFKTWASIEPIIDVYKSFDMVVQTIHHCHEYRFGLNSLKKDYTKQDILDFMDGVDYANSRNSTIVWKESVRKFIE